MFQLIFYVPASHLEQVKNALFEAGAGQCDDYEHCAWQTLGQGQFRPQANSRPFLGTIGQLEIVEEYRVEMICSDTRIKAALTALLAAHPYQQPAYAVYKALTLKDL